MERTHRSLGGSSQIVNEHGKDAVDTVSDLEQLPVTFAQAEHLNAYDALTALHDHSLSVRVAPEGVGTAAHHLAELALSAAVVRRWSGWQPLSMHRALLAGASLAEVAAAAGTSEAEAYEQWEQWAEGQIGLNLPSSTALGADAAAIRARLGRAAMP